MRKLLSILLTVYNQKDLVAKNLQEIIKYKGGDIEIVISDDASSDDFEELVNGLHDERIKYYRSPENEGHDLNILNGINHCSCPYIYLFRSRDLIIPEMIPVVVQTVLQNPDCSYFQFSSGKGDHFKELRFEDKTLLSADETVRAIVLPLIHPSGQLYRTKDLRTDVYKKYLKKHFDSTKYAFCVHVLIRMDLAVKGNFKTSDQITWRWADSLAAKDKATNSIAGGVSPYHPSLQYPRYLCELDFAYHEIEAPYNVAMCKLLISYYAYQLTYLFARINRSGIEARHYGTIRTRFRVAKERKTFKAKTLDYISDWNSDTKEELRRHLGRTLLINATYSRLVHLLQSLFQRPI